MIYTTVVNWQPVIWTITWSVVINCNPNGDKEWWWLRKTATPKKETAKPTAKKTTAKKEEKAE